MADAILLVESVDAHVTRVTLNRPAKRNALSIELAQTLGDAIVEAEKNRAMRVLIFRGNGPSFCAGLDLHEASNPANAERSAKALARLYLELSRSPLITIAQAHGAAFGGGAGLVAACDLAVADESLRMGFPEVHRGLVAGLVTAILRRQLGDRTLRELILLGQEIPASRALQLGLVQRVVSPDALELSVMQMAREACDAAPGAVARTKRLLDDLDVRPLEVELTRALQDHLLARNSDEAREGIEAFLHKRKPQWGERD